MINEVLVTEVAVGGVIFSSRYLLTCYIIRLVKQILSKKGS